MAIKTFSQLLISFSDNVMGLIKAVDLRNFVDSVSIKAGITSAGGIGVAGLTPILLAQWDANAPSKGDIPDFLNGRVTVGPNCDGDHTINMHISFEASLNTTYVHYLYINGIEVYRSRISTPQHKTGLIYVSESLGWTTPLVDGDYLEIWIAASSAGSTYNIDRALFGINRVV